MATKISATDLSRRTSDILNRVHYRGERFVVERNGENIAALEPVGVKPGVTLGELIERLKDLPRPDDGFAEDLEAVLASQPKVGSLEWDD